MSKEHVVPRLASTIGVLMLILLAFGLRLHRLGFQPLWGDEGWSFYFASKSLGGMIWLTAEDIHPPLYYVLLSGWLRLIGSTPEAARLLSIFFGTLLVPLAYRVATRVFDTTAGVTSAAVVTVAPFAIYYSQEVRMYGLVTLLGLGSIYFFSQLTKDARVQVPDGKRHPVAGRRLTKHSLGYILTTAGALYTMYYAFFIPVFQLFFFAILKQGPRLRNWTRQHWTRQHWARHPFIRSLATACILYLPWVIIVGTKLVSYVQGKRVAEGYAPLGPLRFFVSHLIAFSLGHLSGTTHILAWATLLFLPIALLGLAYRPSRSTFLFTLYLLIPLLLGYIINLVYPFTPRYFERTLMLAAPAWWLLLGAGLAWIWRRSRLAVVGVSAVVLLVQIVLLLDFYNVPRYPNEDYRSLLAYVRTHSSPDDAFLASYQWQVGYYYAYLPPPRPVLYEVPGWGETWAADPTSMRADLDTLIAHHPRLWFPAYQALGRMWETQVELYLNQSAFPAQVDWNLPSTKLLLYAQGDQGTVTSPAFNFANRLLMEEATVGDTPVEAGRGIAPITLLWQKLDNLGSDHSIALRLTDTNAVTWASRDSLPHNGDASFTALAIGERLLDRHGLTIPAGTPPGNYQLRLSVYDQADDRPLDLLDANGQPRGVEAALATVQVVPPQRPLAPDSLPVQYPVNVDFDQRVRLLGFSIGQGPFRAGDPLTFSLFWQSLADGQEPYVVFAQLQDEAGEPVALSETPPTYPSQHWSDGTLLRDPRQIGLPATLPAGSYRLAVGLLRPDRSRVPVEDGDQLILTSVETTQRAHNFTPPSAAHSLDIHFGGAARLVGYDLRGGMPLRPGQSLTLVLYWHAQETFDRRYTVFVHLVDANGHIFGQQDQIPGNGEFPTTSWVPGEYLTDAYAIPIKIDTPPGEYQIELGFYDPLDGARLPVTNIDGQSLGDRLLLSETKIEVE